MPKPLLDSHQRHDLSVAAASGRLMRRQLPTPEAWDLKRNPIRPSKRFITDDETIAGAIMAADT